MRILILGGSVFLGRAITDVALARRHRVTHFHRGQSAPDDLRAQTLRVDRTDASALRNAIGECSWDAVIDTSGYMPQVVQRSVDALQGRIARYLFVSSISAYASFERDGYGEEAALWPAPEPLPEVLDMALYGPLKAGCEAVVRTGYGERATIVRPGLIVGPHDPTDRFTYWLARVARGGAVLAPGRPGRTVQFVDVRDLARWMIGLVEGNVTGTFNATGQRCAL